jgi:acetate kinase
MSVLTVNVGSSSVRLGLFTDGAVALRARRLGRDGQPAEALRAFVAEDAAAPRRVAHRIVHGGARFRAPVRVDAGVERALEGLATLAPLHNPPALDWLRAARAVFAGAAQVAVFDTAFFADLPERARLYGLPADLAPADELRRFGFHGIAHEAMWRRWRELRPDLPDGGRLVSLQLGSGCSAAAIAAGRPLDTSMGFSPLEGLVMATRPGDVDPGLLLHLQRAHGVGPDRLEEALNRRAGLLGLSGTSGDVGTLLAGGGDRARVALDVYCHRLRKYVGAYLAVLEGADGIVFGGGVGEHVPEVRRRALAGLGFCGVELDEAANAAARGGEARLSRPGSACEIWALAVDEARVLAEAVLATAGGG